MQGGGQGAGDFGGASQASTSAAVAGHPPSQPATLTVRSWPRLRASGKARQQVFNKSSKLSVGLFCKFRCG